MKVRVAYTVEADDFVREAINRYYGRPGKATREQVADWYRDQGEDAGNQLLSTQEYYREEEE